MELFEKADVRACSTLHLSVFGSKVAFQCGRKTHFSRFGYRISVDGEHLMRFQIHPD